MKVTAFMKKADLLVQALLLVILFANMALQLNNTTFYYCCILGWQVLSMLVHGIYADRFYASVYRGRFFRLLLSVLTVMVLVAVTMPLLVFLLALIVLPVINVKYLLVCADEVLILRRKALVHLK